MKNFSFRKIAPFGLLLSLLAALAAFGIYIVEQKISLEFQISLGVIVLGLALAILLDPQRAKEIVSGRQAKYGSNAFLMTVAVIGILAVINYLVFNNSKRWDLTADQQNTLAKETLDLLANLPSNVVAEAYFTPQTPSDQAKTMLESYKSAANGKFSYELIDPDSEPTRAVAAKITRDGSIVLKIADRQEVVNYVDETEISAAIIRLSNPGKRAVYFLTGHNEFDLEASAEQGYSSAKTALTQKNYTVNSLNLVTTPKIPEDALSIIIAGSNSPLTQAEVDLLKAYVANGGSLVVEYEPLQLTKFGTSADPLASYLSAEWGISLHNDLIIDASFNPPVVAVANSYGSHLITDKLKKIVTLFPTSRSLVLKEGVADVTLSPLVQTSNQTWGETDFESMKNNKVTPDQGKDFMGPLTVAVAGERTQTKGRVVVFGDAEFAANQYFSQYGNGDLFINSVDWAASQENLINLTAKNKTERMLVAPSVVNMGLILLGTIFVMPGAVIAIGITVWLQRRRRG